MDSDVFECPPGDLFGDDNAEFCLWILVHISKMATAHNTQQVCFEKKYLIENNIYEKPMFICFACTCIILNLYGKFFEDWFTAKSVCEDEAFVNLA